MRIEKIPSKNFSFNLMRQDVAGEMHFKGCPLEKNKWCELTTIKIVDQEVDTINSFYRIEEEGKVIETKEDLESDELTSLSIQKITNNNVELEKEVDGRITSITLQRK